MIRETGGGPGPQVSQDALHLWIKSKSLPLPPTFQFSQQSLQIAPTSCMHHTNNYHTHIPRRLYQCPYQRYQLDDGNALTGRVLIAEPANPVRRNNQLRRILVNFNFSWYSKGRSGEDLTWTVLSNQRLPPLNLLPAPVNICLNISFMLLQTIVLENSIGVIWCLNPRPGLIWGILHLLVEADNKEGGGNALKTLNVNLAGCKQLNGERMPL